MLIPSKLIPFATSDSDTYRTVTAVTIFDLSFQPNAIQAVTHGIQMSAYTSDMTPPEIAGFSLDLRFDQLAFNEAVKTSTFDFTVVTIKSKCTGGRNFAITGGVFVPVNLPEVLL